MITLVGFWNGRDVKFATECTEAIKRNAVDTVHRINMLITIFTEATGINRDDVTSGWRPAAINDATANAAHGSNHLIGKAGDVDDKSTGAEGDYDRAFAEWCTNHPEALAECGLWMEDARWCAKVGQDGKLHYWVHLQTVPPRSGKRIYIPSANQPTAPAFLNQRPLPHTLKV